MESKKEFDAHKQAMNLSELLGKFNKSNEFTGGNQMVDKEIVAASDADEPITYEIKLRGHLQEHWSDWLGGLAINHDAEGHSLLIGTVPDQAALYGILAQIRDLGLTLISITPQTSGDPTQGF